MTKPLLDNDLPEEEKLSIAQQLVGLWQEHKPTLLSLIVLALLTALCYFASTWSAIHLAHGARILADAVRQVNLQHGNDEALQRELLLRLSEIQHRDDISEVMLHLATAFAVAIVIIITVEIYSAARTRREITEYREAVAKEVWSALSGRLVPGAIVTEIHDILKASAAKENVRYVLTFLKHQDLPDNVVVLQRKLSYTIRNLTGQDISHPIISRIHNNYPDMECADATGQKITLPRHIELKVGNHSIPLSEVAGTIKKNRHGQPRELRYEVKLTRKRRSVDVFLMSEEAVPLAGENPYIQTVPVTNLTLTVDNRIENLVRVRDVMLAHPNWADFTRRPDGSYVYEGGILPGQSLLIMWEPVPGPVAAPVAAPTGHPQVPHA